MKKRKIFIVIFCILISIALIFLISIAVLAKGIDYGADEILFEASKSTSITKLYYDGNLNKADPADMYDPQLFEEICGTNEKEWYPYDDISENVKDAFVSMEDRSFFEHKGIDVKRSAAAVLNYFVHFKPRFGGSTITQQVIKNISGDNETSAKRKVTEVIRALHLEGMHSKEEIFEVYMNIVGMGDGIIGIGRAAEVYFGKSPAKLDIAEAATLVGIANAPGRYNPYRNPDACLKKRNKVLYSLLECEKITEAQYRDLKSSPLGTVERSDERGKVNSWFAETVIYELAEDLAKSKNISREAARSYVVNGGLKIYTTVSPKIQKILEEYFENPENLPKEINGNLEISFVISDPGSGNLLGIIGAAGKKSSNRILNYASSNITPGSALKPLALYAPLLDEGAINWASVFDDVPSEISYREDGSLKAYPKNSPDIYEGLVNVSRALAVSKNTVAVKMYKLLGGEKIFKGLRESYGFSSLVKNEKRGGALLSDIGAAPLALGQLTDGVPLRKLCEAYNVFANEGELCKGKSYIRAFDHEGNLLIEREREAPKTIMNKKTARIMNRLLMQVADFGTAKSIKLKELIDTAGKTGTSGNNMDKVFIGYTPYMTAGIWCGSKGAKESLGSISKTHLAMWDEIMIKIHREIGAFEGEERSFSTEGLLLLPYCKDSGQLFSENCLYDLRGSRIEYGYFTSDNKPKGECEAHILCDYDIRRGMLADEMSEDEDIIKISLIKGENRDIPREICVTDSEFLYDTEINKKNKSAAPSKKNGFDE